MKEFNTEEQQYMQQAMQLHQAGEWLEAEELYQQILTNNPQHHQALHFLGLLACQRGNFRQALKLLQQAIALQTNEAVYYQNLGVAYKGLNQLDEAVTAYQQALQLAPNNPGVHFNLASTYQTLGQWEAAERHYQQVLAQEPNHGLALKNSADVLAQLGQIDQAIAYYQRLWELQPQPAIMLALTQLYERQQQWDLASHYYQQLLSQFPDQAELWSNRGRVLQEMNQRSEAIECYQRALALKPELAEAWHNLGHLHNEHQQLELAIQHFEQAIALKPDYAEAYFSLGTTWNEVGDYQQALVCYQTGRRHSSTQAHRLREALLLPYIYTDQTHLVQTRERLSLALQELLSEGLCFENPQTEIITTCFQLAYQGYNDRKLNSQLAQLYRPSLPEHIPLAKHTSERMRVGFISHYFYDHSVSHCYQQAILGLPREQFEVILLAVPGHPIDAVTTEYKARADAFITLPPALNEARQFIAQLGLDALIYTDIGMDPFTYLLAFTRLAPIQCAFPGHPVTTGIPTIDYFISSQWRESSEAQEHYSEHLVCLKAILNNYPYPHLTEPLKTRRELGLPEKEHLYVCPMTLFKIHPDFDQTVAEILRTDPQGRVLFFQSGKTRFHKILEHRFQQTIPDVYHRITFLPFASRQTFLHILNQTDVLLDSFHFGAGNTAYLSLAFGIPLITWPSPYLRGRMTAGHYHLLGLQDCIAQSPRDYVSIATQIGQDRDYRESLQQKLLAINRVLYENPSGSKQLGQFLLDIRKKSG